MANKLFIPGPTTVKEDILKELSTPQIGHRTEDFRKLFSSIKPGLKSVFGTENDCIVSTSSGSGLWEASIRSCVQSKVLHAVNGAFSNKWARVSESCGKKAEKINFELGNPVDAEAVEKELSENNYEAFCMVHNETSTGVASNLVDISKVMSKNKDVLFFVDAVSSLGGMPIDADKNGIDICIASSQKAMALPPGISFASISKSAYKKAESVSARGYYFDILELKKSYEKDETPYTPSIPHLYALRKQLERIEDEGLKNRFKRHEEMAEYSRNWAKELGFEIFSKEGYQSNTITCVSNKIGADIKKIKETLSKKDYLVGSGYKKVNEELALKGLPETFRIAHMGDTSNEELKEYLEEFSKVI